MSCISCYKNKSNGHTCSTRNLSNTKGLRSTDRRLLVHLRLQDTDAGYMSKMDMSEQLSSTSDEFHFFKALYDAVREHSTVRRPLAKYRMRLRLLTAVV